MAGSGVWRGRVGGGDGRRAVSWSRAGSESYPTARLQLPPQISARLTSKAKLAPHLKIEARL